MGKVSERIIVKRLSYLVKTSHLIYNNQIGGRLKKLAVDAAILLILEVELNLRYKLKTSALFLDVKGAFNHVVKNRLIQILQNLKLLLNLILWVKSFMTKRQIRFQFNR